MNVEKARWKEDTRREGWKTAFRWHLGPGALPAESGPGAGPGSGAGPGAGPASVRPRTRSAGWVPAPRGPRHWLQALPWSHGSCCGRRDAPPARPAPGLRWLHIRPVLAVDATAPRADTGLPRGDGRQVRGGDRGSGQRKGAKFELGSGIGDSGSRIGSVGTGIWDSVLGWTSGSGILAASTQPRAGGRGRPWRGPARCRLRRSGVWVRGRCPLGWCLRRATRSLTPGGRCQRPLLALWLRVSIRVPFASPGSARTHAGSRPSPCVDPQPFLHDFPPSTSPSHLT